MSALTNGACAGWVSVVAEESAGASAGESAGASADESAGAFAEEFAVA